MVSAGPAGSATIYTVTSPLTKVAPSTFLDYAATCTQGGKAISGGLTQDLVVVFLNESAPNGTGGWKYSVTNLSSGTEASAYFVTTCAL